MEPAEKKVKNSLENYEYLSKLGEGAFGTVMLARDKRTDEQVAVKSVDKEMTTKLNKEVHVMREKKLMETLKHPNIVELKSTFQDEKNLYFVFEVARFGSLDKLVRKCQNNIGEHIVRLFFAQLVNVIELLQKMNIMHRDLKPQNIILDENYNVKVIDFGDARQVDEKRDSDDEDNNNVNPDFVRRDTFVGTVNYMSPEVINDEP